MKCLRKFETEAEKDAWRGSDEYASPNIVLTNTVVYYDLGPIIKGVSIQHINGKLYTISSWSAKGFTNEEANGVAIIDDACSFVIAKTNYQKAWETGGGGLLVENVMATTDSSEAKTDYVGETNTNLIKVYREAEAARACANYLFPNGAKGYLPALGELVTAFAYLSDIEAAMSLIGGDAIPAGNHWSSTQYDYADKWALRFENGQCIYNDAIYSYNVRPFTTLNV